MLVSTTAPHVEVYTREADAWTLRVYRKEESLRLPSVEIRIAVESLHEGITLDPLRPHAVRLR